MEDIIIIFQAQRVKILLVLKSDAVKEQFEKHDIIKQVGHNHVFDNETDAIEFAKKCLKNKVKRHRIW